MDFAFILMLIYALFFSLPLAATLSFQTRSETPEFTESSPCGATPFLPMPSMNPLSCFGTFFSCAPLKREKRRVEVSDVKEARKKNAFSPVYAFVVVSV